jgi:hypothetical protein
MPTIDQCEPQVVRAFEKAGWIVTHQPFYIRLSGGESAYADLRLRRPEQSLAIIVLEVKCFAQKRSLQDEFYHAVGQYLFYGRVLAIGRIEAPLYLTVPEAIYRSFFSRRAVQAVIQQSQIKIITIDIQREEIVQWID